MAYFGILIDEVGDFQNEALEHVVKLSTRGSLIQHKQSHRSRIQRGLH